MTTNITELASHMRGLAEAATHLDHNESPNWYSAGELLEFAVHYAKNARFIEAISPANVITILDALASAQAENARLKTSIEGITKSFDIADKIAQDSLARLAELAQQEPVLFVSAGQLKKQTSVPDMEENFGTYLPVRNTMSGKFTEPLFAAAGASPQPVAWPIDGDKAKRIAEKHFVTYEVAQDIARDILTGASPVQPSQAQSDIPPGYTAIDCPACGFQGCREAQPSLATERYMLMHQDGVGNSYMVPDVDGNWTPFVAQPSQALELKVWFGPMPESNGKSNWTAILHKGDLVDGFQFGRSEYKDRVRYDADCMRHLIGELADQPDILAYDGNLKEDCRAAINAKGA